MTLTAQEKNKIRVNYLKANTAGDMEKLSRFDKFFETEEWKAKSVGTYEPEPGSNFTFDEKAGVPDLDLRTKLLQADNLKEQKGVLHRRGFAPESDYVLDAKGRLALTPTGMRKGGWNPNAKGRNTLINPPGFDLRDIPSFLVATSPEVVGSVGGAIVGSTLAPGVGTIAGGAAGAAIGKSIAELAEVFQGYQEQSFGEVAKDVAIEAAIGGVGEAIPIGIGKALGGTLKGTKNLAVKGYGMIPKKQATGEVLEATSGLGNIAKESVDMWENFGGRSTFAANVGEGPFQPFAQILDRLLQGLSGPRSHATSRAARDKILTLLEGESKENLAGFSEMLKALDVRRGSLEAMQIESEAGVKGAFGTSLKFSDLGPDASKLLNETSEVARKGVSTIYRAVEESLGGGSKLLAAKKKMQKALNSATKDAPGKQKLVVKELAPIIVNMQRVVSDLPEYISVNEADYIRKIFQDTIQKELGIGKQTPTGRVARKLVKAIDDSMENLSDRVIKKRVIESFKPDFEKTLVGTKKVLTKESKRYRTKRVKDAVKLLKKAREAHKEWKSKYNNKAIQSLRIGEGGNPIDPARIPDMLLAPNQPNRLRAVKEALPEGDQLEFTKALRNSIYNKAKDSMGLKGKKSVSGDIRARLDRMGRETRKALWDENIEVGETRALKSLSTLDETTKALEKHNMDSLVKSFEGARGSERELEAHFQDSIKTWLGSRQGLLQFDSLRKDLSKSKNAASRKTAKKLQSRLTHEIFRVNSLKGPEIRSGKTVSGTTIEDWIADKTPEVVQEVLGDANYAQLAELTQAIKAGELGKSGAGGLMEQGIQIGAMYGLLTGDPTGVAVKGAAHFYSTERGQEALRPVLRAIRNKEAPEVIRKLGEAAMKKQLRWTGTPQGARILRVIGQNIALDSQRQ